MRWRTLIVLVALIALLIGYYWIHKPFDSSFAQTLVGIGQDVLPLVLLAVGGGSIGRWLLRRFGLTFQSRAEMVTVEALLGLGLIANPTLIVGLPDAIFASWLRQGDDYLLVYNTELESFKDLERSGPSVKAFNATVPHWLTPIWSNGDYTLYTWQTF